MLVLVTYDVNTTTAQGRKRLRQVAKCCVAHGQRVQNSVFECSLDEVQYVILRDRLSGLIDDEKTVSDFTIWEIIINGRLFMLAPSRHMILTDRLFYSAKYKHT